MYNDPLLVAVRPLALSLLEGKAVQLQSPEVRLSFEELECLIGADFPEVDLLDSKRIKEVYSYLFEEEKLCVSLYHITRTIKTDDLPENYFEDIKDVSRQDGEIYLTFTETHYQKLLDQVGLSQNESK